MAFNKSQWSLKFETADEARKAIRDCALAVYLVSALSLLIVSVTGPAALWDVAIGVALGLWLQFRRSRVAAILLLILFGAGICVTAYNMFGGGSGGKNVVLAVIVFIAALRATLATFKLKQLESITAETVQSGSSTGSIE